MNLHIHKINPFSWTIKTITIIFVTFFILAIPSYLLGFSAFATTVLPQNASLRIPSIGIFVPISPATKNGKIFDVPDARIASYTNNNKIFLYAHNYSAFKDLDNLKIGDQINYLTQNQNQVFYVDSTETLATKQINMKEILSNTKTPELILMTCAGQKQANDYSARLIVRATKN